jgi:hypothetical protein
MVKLFVLAAAGAVRRVSGCLAGRVFPSLVFDKDGPAARASRMDVKNATLTARDIKVIFGSTSFVILFVRQKRTQAGFRN